MHRMRSGLVLFIGAILLIGVILFIRYIKYTTLLRPDEIISTRPSDQTIADNKKIVEEILQGISGFRRISPEDKERITAVAGKEGADVYGEITPQSLVKAMQYARDVSANDVFYDLGCGVGGAVFFAYLTFPLKKSKGIELCTSRYDAALIALDRLHKKGLVEPGRSLEIVYGDFLKADLDDATIVYTCSTCFSDELVEKIMQKLATLKPGLIVITLKEFPDNHKKYGFTAIVDNKDAGKKLILPMTWSEGSPVYIYQLMEQPGIVKRFFNFLADTWHAIQKIFTKKEQDAL